MELRIQYAKTSDGVSIGYLSLGEGRPVVFCTGVWGDAHLQMDGLSFPHGATNGLRRRGWRVILYDGRGTGFSDRDRVDFSMAARIADMEAVVNHLQLQEFALCGSVQGGPTAIAYAVQHAERISHLILANTFASGQEFEEARATALALFELRGVTDKDWEFFTLNAANGFIGFQDSEVARRLAASYRTTMSPEAYLSFWATVHQLDVTKLLGSIAVPTLVVYSPSHSNVSSLDVTRRLAARIPNAHFITTDHLAAAIDEFVTGQASPPPPRAKAAAAGGTAVILFADIADSTALTEQLGDAAFRDRSRALDEALRALIREHSGKAVEGKLLGDGLMAVFNSAREAIECALRSGAASDATDLRLHLGLHAGDVIHEAGNVYGGAVNIASRIAGASAPGEVLVSDIVRGLARTSANVAFLDRGEHELKGVSDPVRLYEVRWRESAGGG